jgi:hypothetical protein
MQWLMDPNQCNVDNLNNARHEASRHFRNNRREYLKPKLMNLNLNSKNKNIRELYRGLNDFKNDNQPRTNIVKDEKGDMIADFHSVLARWRTHFSQLLNGP